MRIPTEEGTKIYCYQKKTRSGGFFCFDSYINKTKISKKMTFINGILIFFLEIYGIINYNILRPWRQN
jgi:hypothetical protein